MTQPIAIITARGGSKRIPRKNIKEFMGYPIIAWPIAVAKASGLFSDIVISTDDAEIADVATQCGAKVPFMRPAELADDHTGTAAVLYHAVTWLRDNATLPRHVCCIYPTAPFLRAEDLRVGLEHMHTHNATCALSVTTFDFPILRAFHADSQGNLAFHWPEYAPMRSQDLPEFYHDAGQFYWVNTEYFLEHPKDMLGSAARPVVLPRTRVQDLDTPEDWAVAENMARAMNLQFSA